MKHKVLPLRVDDELYTWLKEYAQRKHSKMAAVITRLLVEHKENDEMDQRARQTSRRKSTIARKK
jgi:hypothetical protein